MTVRRRGSRILENRLLDGYRIVSLTRRPPFAPRRSPVLVGPKATVCLDALDGTVTIRLAASRPPTYILAFLLVCTHDTSTRHIPVRATCPIPNSLLTAAVCAGTIYNADNMFN
jgi:hypothetical protein